MENVHSIDVEEDQFAYRYDTQLLIDRRDEDLDEDEIAEYISEHFEGNCLIAVGDEDLIKIHFHTNEPWKILDFDEGTNKKIQLYMEQIAQRTGNMAMIDGKVPPHITLSAFDMAEEEKAIAGFTAMEQEFEKGQIFWCSVGMFLPHTIYLSPVLNAYLQKLSESVFSKIRYLEEVRIQIRYQPFSWFPHTTLGKRLNQAEMREAFIVMQNQFAPFTGEAVEIGLARTNPYRDLCKIKLK